MRIRLVNPNTSGHITQRMVDSAQPCLPADWQFQGVTATQGPTAVTQPAQVAEATANVVSLVREHAPVCDGIIVGISLDCGLAQARQAAGGIPVVGMTEAACLLACARGDSFGLLTLGSAMAPLYQQLLQSRGLASRLAGIGAPDVGQAFSASSPLHLPLVVEQLDREARRLVDGGASGIVLAGAVLCGYAQPLARRVGVPFYDGAACGALALRSLLAL